MKLYHKSLTDEEQYKNIKEWNKTSPGVFMDADEWKRRRLLQLSKEGRIWSK